MRPSHEAGVLRGGRQPRGCSLYRVVLSCRRGVLFPDDLRFTLAPGTLSMREVPVRPPCVTTVALYFCGFYCFPEKLFSIDRVTSGHAVGRKLYTAHGHLGGGSVRQQPLQRPGPCSVLVPVRRFETTGPGFPAISPPRCSRSGDTRCLRGGLPYQAPPVALERTGRRPQGATLGSATTSGFCA